MKERGKEVEESLAEGGVGERAVAEIGEGAEGVVAEAGFGDGDGGRILDEMIMDLDESGGGRRKEEGKADGIAEEIPRVIEVIDGHADDFFWGGLGFGEVKVSWVGMGVRDLDEGGIEEEMAVSRIVPAEAIEVEGDFAEASPAEVRGAGIESMGVRGEGVDAVGEGILVAHVEDGIAEEEIEGDGGFGVFVGVRAGEGGEIVAERIDGAKGIGGEWGWGGIWGEIVEIGGGGEAVFFEPEESGAGGEAMGEDHYAIVGEGSFVGEIVHSGEGLADFGEVRGGGIGGVGIGGELFAVVIIAVDGDTEEVGVGEEEIDDVWVGVEMIPGDESDRGVEGDAVHFGDELGEVESAVGLGE